MKKRNACPCTSEFDAEVAFKRLSEKYNDLAEVLSKYLSEVDTSDRLLRANSASQMAEILIRIVGGKKVPEGGYPECCLIGNQNFNGTLDWFCTGVLVHPRVVLTAAHCYKSSYSYVVALDTINQNSLSNAEVINVKKAIPHPQYQQTGKFNDISVLVLRNDAQTPPITLATSQEISGATKTTLVGFGNEDVNSTVGFGIKREVTVNIESIRKAAGDNLDRDEIKYDFESDLEFIAGGNGYDSCNGDSGGPAYVNVNGIRKVAGLTSRATRTATKPCGDGGIYTRVDVHDNFISQFY